MQLSYGPLPRAKFHVYQGNMSPLQGGKTIFGPLSKCSTGRQAALHAVLPVTVLLHLILWCIACCISVLYYCSLLVLLECLHSSSCVSLDSNELLHAQHYPAVPLPGAGGDSAAAHRPQTSQTQRRVAADGMKPPKKPLTPYMIFSKRVSAQFKVLCVFVHRLLTNLSDIFERCFEYLLLCFVQFVCIHCILNGPFALRNNQFTKPSYWSYCRWRSVMFLVGFVIFVP